MRKILTGLLCAFAAAAAEAAELPPGYMAVEYIESTKGCGQYINTGYVHKENTKIVCEVSASSQMGSQPGSAAVFGACKGNQLANAFVFYAKDSFGAVCYQRDAQEDTGEGHTFPCDVRTTITCVRQLAMWSDSGDNKTIYIPMDKVEGGICPLLIFDKNTATDTGVKPEGSAAVMRLYSFKIYEDEALVHDFVPCVQEGTGKAGLYDIIGGGFHGNAGTGADFQRAMPSGYMAVEYIESTAGGKQYINTEYVPKKTTKVDCLVNVADNQPNYPSVVFGTQTAEGGRSKNNDNMSFFAWFRRQSTAYNRGTEEKQGKGFGYDKQVHLVCNGLNASWSSIDGLDSGEIDNAGPFNDCEDQNFPFYIFALDEPTGNPPYAPKDSTYLVMKLYSFKIYEGETLVRDFVPCIEKATGKMGLYDIVKFRFYSNAGNKEDFPRTLPHGFVSIDCIESTGLERIDTGYKCLSGTKIDCSIQVASSQPKDYSAVFGSRNRVYWTDSYEFHVRWDGKNEPIYLRNSEKKGGDAEDFPYDQRVALTCHGKTATWTWGGNSKTLTVDNEPCDCVNPLMIFDVNRDGYGGSSAEGNPCVMRLYSFRIFEGEAVKRNFVPCIETATGKAGLYDIVEGNFHGNTGTGAFRHHVADVPYWDPVAKSNVVVSCEKVLPETSSFEDCRWYAVMDSVTCGSIVVNGSAHLILADGATLTVQGGENSAGIDVSDGRALVIYGQTDGTGELVANGGKWAAGIGGGKNCAGGAVTVHRGRVTAIGGEEAAGIGGGSGNNGGGGVVRIDDGAFDVRGGAGAKNAIGPGNGGTPGVISISGGIFASKTDPSWLVPSYFCVANTDSQTSVKYPWKVIEGVPVRFIRGTGVTALLYRTDAGGAFVSFPDGGMALPLGIEIELQVQTAPGFVYQGQTHFTVGASDLTKTISAGVQYIDRTGGQSVADGALTVVNESTTVFDDNKWYVVTGRVERGTITVNGSAHLILTDGANLTVQGDRDQAGLSVSEGHSLNIYSQTGGTGELVAKGGFNGAGIGGDANKACGKVTICSGTVTATGGENGAGIGGGCLGAGGNVTIHGGAIDVRAGANVFSGAIGPGANGKSGTIAISGGIFASKTDASWLASGYVCVKNTDSQTSATYPWRVMGPVPVRFIRGLGVTALLYRTSEGGEYVPFPDEGIALSPGTEIDLQVQTAPGFVYQGQTHFTAGESGLMQTISAGVQYIDRTGGQSVADGALTVVNELTDTFDDNKWYVVTGRVVRGTITVNGSAHLILTDGANLTVEGGENQAGLSVLEGHSLNIYGQVGGTGELVAKGGQQGAGIGGDANKACGKVTICSGTVTATGGVHGAGIGGGAYGAWGKVMIYRGTVTATGDLGCAGIGAGYQCSHGGEVEIDGGAIDASAGDDEKNAIGPGPTGTDGAIYLGSAIFTFKPVSGWLVRGYYCVPNEDPQTSAKYPWRAVKGTSVQFTRGTGVTELLFRTSKDAPFVPFPAGETNLLAGTEIDLQVQTAPGFVYQGQTHFTVGESELSQTISAGAQYINEKGEPCVTDDVPIIVDKSTDTFYNGKWYVVTGQVERGTIEVHLESSARLILADGARLKVQGEDHFAGLSVSGLKSLDIYGQVGGTGELEAIGGKQAAGIGGGDGCACGTVTINGGTVKATGAYLGAGIGGGYCGAGGTVTINGGTVTATAGFGSAGIGSGSRVNGGSVTINGGTVTVTGGIFGAGIGGGDGCVWDTVKINGGTVKATGGERSAAIGGGINGKGGIVTIHGGAFDVQAGDGDYYHDAIGPGESGKAESVQVSGGVFASQPDSVWLTPGYVCVANPDSQTSAKYPWAVTAKNSVPVRFIRGPGVAALLFRIEAGEAYMPFPDEGTTLPSGAEVDLKVQTAPGFVYRGQTHFPVGEPGLTQTILTDVQYINEKGEPCVTDGALTFVNASTDVFDDGKWYVVTERVERGKITVNGSAHLILTDGANLTVEGGENQAGLSVPEGKSLVIYGQAGGTGELVAKGGFNGAGIGGGYGTSCGTVTINGGRVTAKAGFGAAGIGGGRNGSSGGTVTINGGTVTATGISSGAGIGGGMSGSGGTVTINGGTVTATGGENGTGIGGGGYGAWGTVTINGGTVTATGGSGCAGIGAGAESPGGGMVRIRDGAIDARAGDDAKNAIGPGPGGSAGTVSISGGIFASQPDSGWLTPGYVCVANADSQTSAKYPWAVTAKSPVSVRFIRGAGVIALLFRIEADVAYKPFPDEGMKLQAGVEVDLQVQIAPGFVYRGPTHFTVGESGLTQTISASVPYVNEKGEPCVADGALTFVNASTDAFGTGWYVVTGRVECGTISVNGAAHLILVDGANLTVQGDWDHAGLTVQDDKSLVIYGQVAGTGELMAKGGNGAGIGGGYGRSGGTVTINGGTVTATSDHCAGIGGGSSGSGGTVTINGGTVTATGGTNGAGIGGGNEGAGGTVTINGGTVTAQGGTWASGIGGGAYGAWGTVTINGGTVTATGGSYSAGIGGGHKDAGSGSVTIRDGAIDVRAGHESYRAIGAGVGGKFGTISVSGGIFAPEPSSDWLAPGCSCVKNPDPQTAAKYPWKVKEGVLVRFIPGSGVTALLYRIGKEGAFEPFPEEGRRLAVGTEIDLQVQTAPGFVYPGQTHFTVGESGITQTISAGVQYVNEKGETCVSDGALTIVNELTDTFDDDKWYVVTGRVVRGTITVSGLGRLVLADGCSLTVNGGIRVESRRALWIYGQSEGTGELKAIGASRCAGIGAGPNVNSGTVRIHGGRIDARAGDGAKDDLGGPDGLVANTGGVFARKPKKEWIEEGYRISSNCQPGTVAPYPWKVLKISWAPVRLTKGTGVDELLFHGEDETAFVPFPDEGTNLLAGAWIRIRVRSKPGYVYTGDVWFCVEASGLTRTFESIEVRSDGDGSPERPWLVGDLAVAWTNGTGGLFVSGEGPMADCIDAYGPIWTAFADDITEVTVGGDITAIGAGAFAGLANLKKVTVSADQLVTIGDYAFADCWTLADLALPNSVEMIGESAFEYCFDLPACVLPASLREIGKRAFLYCWTLAELDIPDSVIEIDDQAFAGCSSLTHLGFGSGLIWLGDSAFSDCVAIEAISIRTERPPSVGDKVFYLVPTSATLTVPAASVNLYKTAKGWENFKIQPAAGPTNETDEPAAERPTLAARLASAAPGAVGDKPAFEVVREGSVVRVTVRLPKALQGVRYRLLGSTDLTFAKPMEVVRGTANGTGGLELSGTVPDGASCYFKVDVEGGNEE